MTDADLARWEALCAERRTGKVADHLADVVVPALIAEVRHQRAASAMPAWLCEFCYARLYVGRLPASWTTVFGCAVCNECQPRIAQDGGYAVVPCGAYAEVPDPRPWSCRPALEMTPTPTT